MIAKKSDGSQAKEKESTDSSTTIEDDDVKGRSRKSQFSSQKRWLNSFGDGKVSEKARKRWLDLKNFYLPFCHVKLLSTQLSPL